MTMGASFCPNCGVSVQPGAHVCASCGKPLATTPAATHPIQEDVSPPSQGAAAPPEGRVTATMQQRGARIVGMAGALVVVGFALTVVSVDPSQGLWMVILYAIVAAAILLAPRRWAAWAATASTVLLAMLTLVVFVNFLPADGFILLAATLAEGGAALALHRGAHNEDSSRTE